MSLKFTAKDVQVLRKKTGVGMMECKSALNEAEGDFDKAIKILREKGAAKAAKKADRIAAEGIVGVKIRGKVGSILEINSETDFVAKNERFHKFADLILDVILNKGPKNLEELKDLNISDDSNLTVEKALQEEILSIGENIKIRRFAKLEGNLISYIHGNGNIAVLVKFNDEINCEDEKFKEYGKNVAMQIAATNPSYLNSKEIPQSVLEEEKEIAKKQLSNSNKPENIIEKIVIGRMQKFYKEVCLEDQAYVKDDKLSVKEYTKNVSKELNCDIKIEKFIRKKKGEGLEKRNEDFGDEVLSLLN